MAKGNPFLGDARGSVGDVTLYVKNGQQVTRVRRRSVRNPNSQGQLIQRAILATIGKAYQAGAAIFDHSFEGVEPGAKSQAKFQKENLRIIRKLIVDDLDAQHGDGQSLAAVVPRGAVWPVANPYRISTGSLLQTVFDIRMSNSALGAFLNGYNDDITLAQWCSNMGVVDDDIFTVCVFAITGNSGWSASDQQRFQTAYETVFGFIRLRVKTAALTSSALISASNWEDLFEISKSTVTAWPDQMGLDEAIEISSVVSGALAGSIGVIRSRENSVARSTCDMVCPATIGWGIIAKYISDLWDPSALSAGDSDLILEGGGFQ